MDYREKSETRDGMRIDWDMPIPMDDGIVLRCDIYRPVKPGRYSVIMTYGPYGKWLHFDDLYHEQWKIMCETRPDVPAGKSGLRGFARRMCAPTGQRTPAGSPSNVKPFFAREAGSVPTPAMGASAGATSGWPSMRRPTIASASCLRCAASPPQCASR